MSNLFMKPNGMNYSYMFVGLSHFRNAMFDAGIPLFQVVNAALAIMMWCSIDR